MAAIMPPASTRSMANSATTTADRAIKRQRVTTKPAYSCDFPDCGATLARSFGLARHKAGHSKQRPFKCTFPDCGATFTRKDSLVEHGLKHSGIKSFKCPEVDCGATFARSNMLKRHRLGHSETKPFECSEVGCGATFARSDHLEVHTRTHTGEKPYVCNYPDCGYKCSRSSALRTHERTHTGACPFKCTFPGCNDEFARSDSLRLHERTHTGERPYKCPHPGCDAAFPRGDTLKAHDFYYHTAEGQQKRKREEERIAKLLTNAGVPFKREHYVTFGCFGGSFARIDFIIDRNGKVIVIEVDEDQHRQYGVACEVARMLSIYESWMLEGNTLPVHIIRYNPHAFQVDGKSIRVTKKDREAQLLRAIDEAAESATEGLQVQYMYYDMVDGKPAMVQDEAFSIEDCCVESIVS